MSKPVVLIAEELSPATVEALGPDVEVRSCDGADRADLLKSVVDVDALLIRSATQVDAEVFAAAKQLKVVARAGVGLDNVDVKAATTAGVMVVNAPQSNIVSAAEHAVALLLAVMRTRSSNILRLRPGVIGSISAWLPSRRSTAHHCGALVITLVGQVRSGRSIGVNGW